MKWWWPLLLLVPGASLAQDDMWDDEDWGDDEAASVWSGFVEAGLVPEGARLKVG